ncbi:MAG: hypothetical protein KOO60_10555 [Gemmatimonadales bacterium]|nr:hypothetical protein [Gemmatimonadales bacterium]
MIPRHSLFISLILFLLIPSAAFTGEQIAGVPDLFESTIETRATHSVSVLVCPGGDGRSLNQAMLFGGEIMDATIEIHVRDLNGYPIHGFPMEDIWMEMPGVNFCLGGGRVDFHTDSNGYTEFSLPKAGGGWSEDFDLVGLINDSPFAVQSTLSSLRMNSPDMNGDGVVNLLDVGLYASVYWEGYSYAADFHWDGLLNLTDVSILAQHFGHSCH